ncbi:Leucine-, isoleucine-, valine-, threonine-, and alanine-binding protein [Roseomonas mucosa]|uniref:ABC transporter substrate-binding protein n=1 Tax=Roseomonas TaxID=125216 RepID=UPI000C1A0C76|nr:MULTISPECIES: ABC transporter substrate-binding protein [Roseomonas]ATR21919.1 ABC transporter substrate-binding protein [Roseomonas sp. FDAARGOS_362]MDT8264297.1 ABC transporter substrate-binding protein [Roseomonas sp. DSM 102946]UZO95611.1 Leucine-, isoleucine-, valine-, threonine-, and alanine-binding protein [Roseomonas mucosa]
MSKNVLLPRRGLLMAGAATLLPVTLARPALSQGQPDVIRIGHLTPRTGFLGPLGEFAVQAVQLATEEINAGGGINGRKVEVLYEDSVNPQTASAKAERLTQRDKVACIVGEINSASALAIGQVVQREKVLFINTGANSDALRGSDCQRFMFHTESQNTMMVRTAGNAILQQGLVKGKKYYALTADYAFGHDLLRVARKFLGENGATAAGEDLVPTELTDFSPFLLKIRQARPDVVIGNLAGAQVTNFLKQYSEFGLSYPVAGFGFDIALAWGAGQGNFLGTWPVVWHHMLEAPSARKFADAYRAKWKKPPENQGWSDYTAMKVIAQSMNELKSIEPAKVVEHLEKGAKFDISKSREGYFRAWDHQLMMEMYAITALPPDQVKNQYNIFKPDGSFPKPDESLESIATNRAENACSFPA